MTKILEVKDLAVEFATKRGTVKSVNGLSFHLNEGESLGIVGESGCGKSVTGHSILKLIQTPPGRISSGEILYNGEDLLKKSEKEMRKIRGRHISMIFQEPMTSLNPVFTIGNQLIDVIRTHQKISRKEAYNKSIEMLKTVGISLPKKRMSEYPHQFSGGMRQRVVIAMALASSPSILIADEPTTALDVTIQAQIMEEFKKLKDNFNMSTILISHDLGVISETCDNVIVMYCGQIIEKAKTEVLFKRPAHPYTQGLLKSLPQITDEKVDELPTIEGMVPDLLDLPKGCRFYDRCPVGDEKCKEGIPELTEKENGGWVACFKHKEISS